MLCSAVCRTPLPSVELPKRRSRQLRRSSVPDLPRSGGGFFFRQIRPYLPASWRYGWRWKMLQGIWLVGALYLGGNLLYIVLFRDSEEMIKAKAARYTYVCNDRGEVVDVGYKPIIDAAHRAQRRAKRLLEEDCSE
ncbi:hypothetical protein ERJ75_000193500 [Trypanosoma vivax]|uniref:Uncharacterized protein n=1 Tax=Trypanosoma vivax (strain Y486) TaxID=1055687 RepID=G0UA41_TRYVY|nr:hypothetical protein TRVL_03122 [Trypanosoma vivax]KAH8619166.1 hypothetical protein ERJ75_000193500 [Trypanosoma vivax]CCC52673.1 conserved hypothetical protein [Trypanosoma vivax Y486]